MMIDQQIKVIIQSFLDNRKYQDAIFLAEILRTEENCEETAYLLGKCYIRAGRQTEAMQLLQEFRTPRMKYLLAKCAFDLYKYDDAERILLGGTPLDDFIDIVEERYGEESCYVLSLLCEICFGKKREKSGKRVAKAALILNPLMWSVFEKLHSEKAFLNPADIFNLNMYNMHMGRRAVADDATTDDQNDSAAGSSSGGVEKQEPKETPEKPKEPKETPEKPKEPKETPEKPTTSTALEKDEPNGSGEISIGRLLTLLKDIGMLYHYANLYDFVNAMKSFEQLDSRHKNSANILCRIATLHVDVHDYKTANKYFEKALDIEGYRIEDMYTYSISLWHSGRRVKLSHLSHRLMEDNRLNWNTWAVAAHFMSLEDRRNCAIKYLKRAIQLNPFYGPLYVSLGMEYLAVYDLTQASVSIVAAQNLGAKNYKACIAMGTLLHYYRDDVTAKKWFSEALQLNPRSIVATCSKAMIENRLEEHDEALKTIKEGLVFDPENLLCKYRRVEANYGLENYDEALDEVTELIERQPAEIKLHEIAAKIYKKLDQPHMAYESQLWTAHLSQKFAAKSENLFMNDNPNDTIFSDCNISFDKSY